jgi:hypothetical protein
VQPFLGKSFGGRRIEIQVLDFASLMPGRTPAGLRRKISRFERKAFRIQAGRDGKTWREAEVLTW